MYHTIPKLSFKDSIFEYWVEDLLPFSEAKVYSLEQLEVVVSWMWIKL